MEYTKKYVENLEKERDRLKEALEYIYWTTQYPGDYIVLDLQNIEFASKKALNISNIK